MDFGQGAARDHLKNVVVSLLPVIDDIPGTVDAGLSLHRLKPAPETPVSLRP
jgi:hypothetical protein